MIAVSEACALVQAQAAFDNHSIEALERGLIPFSTLKQLRFISILLQKCGVTEKRRLWVVGQFAGRTLRSTKDLSMAEADALINWLLVGSDGKGDQKQEPCDEAKEIMEAINAYRS